MVDALTHISDEGRSRLR